MKRFLVFTWIVFLTLKESLACTYSGAAMFHWTYCNSPGGYVNITSCPNFDEPMVYCQHTPDWPPSDFICNGAPIARLSSFLSCPNGTDNLPASAGHNPPNCPAITAGSIISVDSQIVSEVISLTGIPFNLVYSSDRVEGMKAWTKAKVPLTHSQFTNVPNMNGFEVKTEIDGVSTTQFISQSAGLSVDITKPTSSVADTAKVTVTYKYNNTCGPIEDLLGANPPPNPVCHYYEAHIDQMLPISYPKVVQNSFNGWTLSIYHSYDKIRGLLLLGDGSVRKTPRIAKTNNSSWVMAPDNNEIYVFDAQDKHVETRDALLGTIKYTFSYSSNRLISVTDAYNNQTTLQYSNGQLVSITSPYNQVTMIGMDSAGNIISVTNPASESYEMTYYAQGLLETFEDPSGVVTTLSYDADGKLVSDVSSSGRSTTIVKALTDQGFNVTETSALGRNTRHEVSTLLGGYYRTTVSPDNSRKYYHQKNSLETIVSDESGFSKTTKLQKNIRFENGFYSPLSLTTQAGMKTKIENFSESATLSNSSDPFSLTQLLSERSVNNKTYSTLFTASTKTKIETSPLGRLTTSILNNYGKLTSIQQGGLTPITLSYDTRGRISTISQGSARTTTLTYDNSGNLASIENPKNEVTSFGYDLIGRPVTQTLPDNRVIAFTYDSRGNTTSVTPPGKPAHNFQYNNLGRISSYIPPTIAAPTTTSTVYTYNNDDQLTFITRPGGQVVEFNYNTYYKNLDYIAMPNNAYRYFSYYRGYLSQTSSEDFISTSVGVTEGLVTGNQIISSPLWHSISYSYNNEHLLSSETFDGVQINFGYDYDSLLTSAGDLSYTRYLSTGLISNSALGDVNQTFNYSNYGELSSIATDHNGSNVYSESMTRDALGRITSRTEQYGPGTSNTFEYEYDSTGRLTTVDKNGSLYSQYSYDSNSNRIAQTINGQSLTGITYDDQDRLTQFGTKSFTYNLNGDLNTVTDSSTGITKTHVYDVFGNLKSVTLPSKTINYGVDAFNRRVIKKNGSTVEKFYIWNKDNQLIAVMDQNAVIKARFVYGAKSHIPEYMIQGTDKFRIVTNHLGSPVVVINSATGAIAQEITYDEFGNILTDSSPGFTPFGFAGCLYDSETKLCRFGARDYDASIGRWLSKDPILFEGRDTNLYGYVLNDPVNLIDPSGLRFGGFLNPGGTGGAIGATIGGVVGGIIGSGFGLPGAIAGSFIGGQIGGAIGSFLGGGNGLDPKADNPYPPKTISPINIPLGPYLPNSPGGTPNACTPNFSGPTISGL